MDQSVGFVERAVADTKKAAKFQQEARRVSDHSQEEQDGFPKATEIVLFYRLHKNGNDPWDQCYSNLNQILKLLFCFKRLYKEERHNNKPGLVIKWFSNTIHVILVTLSWCEHTPGMEKMKLTPPHYICTAAKTQGCPGSTQCDVTFHLPKNCRWKWASSYIW